MNDNEREYDSWIRQRDFRSVLDLMFGPCDDLDCDDCTPSSSAPKSASAEK